MCSSKPHYTPEAKTAHCWALAQVIWASIITIILAVAGGWSGLVGGILLIIGASVCLCGCGEGKERSAFMTGLILNIIAAICLIISVGLLLSFYFAAGSVINAACSSAVSGSCSVYSSSESSCRFVSGCSWSGSACSGTPTGGSSSSSFGSSGTCSGTYNGFSCTNYNNNEISCKALTGCSWSSRRSLSEAMMIGMSHSLMQPRRLQTNCASAAHDAVGIIILIAGIICIICFLLAVAAAFYFYKAMNNPGQPGSTGTAVQMGTVAQATVTGTPVKAQVSAATGATSQPEAL